MAYFLQFTMWYDGLGSGHQPSTLVAAVVKAHFCFTTLTLNGKIMHFFYLNVFFLLGWSRIENIFSKFTLIIFFLRQNNGTHVS